MAALSRVEISCNLFGHTISGRSHVRNRQSDYPLNLGLRATETTSPMRARYHTPLPTTSDSNLPPQTPLHSVPDIPFALNDPPLSSLPARTQMSPDQDRNSASPVRATANPVRAQRKSFHCFHLWTNCFIVHWLAHTLDLSDALCR